MNKAVNIVRAVIGIILLVLFLIFCMENLEKTELEFLGYRAELPLFIVLIITLTLGAFLGYVAGLLTNKKSPEADTPHSIDRK